jgi:Ca-activated chloride channel family protein
MLVGPPAAQAQAPPGSAQQPIRVQTALVSVPAIVSDGAGRYIPGLSAADFRLLDDGEPQQISFFAATDEPLNIALLLDTSKSTVTVLDKIKQAALRFLRQLRPNDRALVATFDSSVSVLCPMTDDRKDLEESIRAAKPGRYVGSKLRDAIVAVTEKRLKPILGRKAIILLSDGQDYGSEAPVENVVSTATESGTVVYTVLYSIDPREAMKKLFGVSVRRTSPGREWRERERLALEAMQQLSSDSAGRLYRVELTDLDETFAHISEELRHQYLLAFYPGRTRLDGNPHNLSVEVSRPGAVVRSRANYRVQP